MSAYSKHLVARSVWPLVCLLSVLIATLAPVSGVSANGPHIGSQELFFGFVGPYDLRVEVIPVVGSAHLTAYVFDADSRSPVSDATITVTGRSLQTGILAGPVASTYLATAQVYTMTVPADEPGDWVFTMVVNSALGEEVLDMPVVLVRGKSGTSWTIIGAAAGIAALLLFWAGRALRRRKQPS